MKENERNVVRDFMKKFGVVEERPQESTGKIESITLDRGEGKVMAEYNGKQIDFSAPRGSAQSFRLIKLRKLIYLNSRDSQYVPTDLQERLVTEMACSHAHGDFGLLGPKGSGKTIVVEEFARRMGYTTDTMVMYQVGSFVT